MDIFSSLDAFIDANIGNGALSVAKALAITSANFLTPGRVRKLVSQIV